MKIKSKVFYQTIHNGWYVFKTSSHPVWVEGVHLAAEQLHVPLELTVKVLAETVHEARVVGHFVLLVEADVLSLAHLVCTILFTLSIQNPSSSESQGNSSQI